MSFVRPHTKCPNAGFTLIEMAIVMIISGFVLVAGVQAYHMYQKSAEIRITNEALARVDKAINDYFTTHGRFPCPSDPGKGPGSAWRGKEWGRDRESGKYDSDGDGIPETLYPTLAPDVSDIWKDGKDGPVSAAYCKTDPDDINKDAEGRGDYYRFCIATGAASICNMPTNPVTGNEPNKWPSPRFNDNDGSQKCGTEGTMTNIKPTDSACASTGMRPDDTVDNNGDDTIDIDPLEYSPESISCIMDVPLSNPPGLCDAGAFNADEKTAGGVGTSAGSFLPGVNPPARDLIVLKGGIPYVDLGLSQSDILDGYNQPLVYAVTMGLTRQSGWDPTKTGIVVGTYDVTQLPQAEMPQEAAQYVVVSLGRNGSDTDWYNAMPAGGGADSTAPIEKGQPDQIISCRFFVGGAGGNSTGGYYTNNSSTGDDYIENENCDVDSSYVMSLGKNMNREMSPDPLKGYYDDTLLSNVSSAYSNLWASKGNNIYNTNTGNVGVNVNPPSEPQSKLDVDRDVYTQADLIVSNLLCAGPGSDTDPVDNSFDCGGIGIDVEKLQVGKTCPPGQVLTKIENGSTYTCATITGLATNFKCPRRTASSEYTVFGGYDSTNHPTQPYKCIAMGGGTVKGKCKWCSSSATLWTTVGGCNSTCP